MHPFQLRTFCDIKVNEQLLMTIDTKLSVFIVHAGQFDNTVQVTGLH